MTRQQTEYCPECRTSVPVEDEHEESFYTPAGEVGFLALDLTCSHTVERGDHIVGPAPGAPYAGPETPVVSRARTRELTAARAARPVEDPWA